MKKLILVVFFLPLFLFSQSEKNPCETLSSINSLIQNNHYRPKPVDDSLSVYVFRTFLSRLDEDNRLFIEPEIAALKKHEYQIDDYINSKNCDFLNDFYVAYSKTIARYRLLLKVIKEEPFALSSDENVIFSKDTFPHVKDETELKHLYKKRILFTILRETAELSTNKDSLLANFNAITLKNKDKVFEKFDCKIASYELSKSDFNAIFYEVFCSYFDPHTEYFSENDKTSFLSTVSPDNLTFGLYISLDEKEDLIVDEVIPGSSAYALHKIDKGDQILKIKYKKEEFEIACSSMKKIEEIISSNDYKIADFTFRKKSGEIYSVRLRKKVMRDYQNNVYSFLLKKDNATFGYIKIPSFYTTFENGKTTMTDDFAKEIFKLQNDDIDGLIIDVENNGGGSMGEAMTLSGMLIDSGPLAILNNNKNNKTILRDTNVGTIYNGPMVVLINGFSASASEFFANAIQDYNRGIIIGTKSLGKASMQRIYPLNPNNDEFLKLTLELFYRVTGKSNQYDGITPDIEIPTLFDSQMPRESSNKTALKNDILGESLSFNYLPKSVYSQVISNSKTRVESNIYSNEISDLNARINPFFDNDLPPITLQFDTVFDNVAKINTLWKEVKTAAEKEYPIAVELNTVDVLYQKQDDFLKTNNTERAKVVRQNYHILEAVNILNDIKNLKP
ncbi:S41 family peptidase [Flavobacterium sp. RSB2_4_14]|uniref:S41 family peptidase n=1 Tax=Flavobacterium sp. RSB2_4_14 TaxID=3447665 RepID=UPI003F34ACD7